MSRFLLFVKFGSMTSFGSTSEHFIKCFFLQIFFSTNSQSFLLQKFLTIQHLFCYSKCTQIYMYTSKKKYYATHLHSSQPTLLHVPPPLLHPSTPTPQQPYTPHNLHPSTPALLHSLILTCILISGCELMYSMSLW